MTAQVYCRSAAQELRPIESRQPHKLLFGCTELGNGQQVSNDCLCNAGDLTPHTHQQRVQRHKRQPDRGTPLASSRCRLQHQQRMQQVASGCGI
eukprot:1161226-Pelagomonas_calceolata.AAC.12